VLVVPTVAVQTLGGATVVFVQVAVPNEGEGREHDGKHEAKGDAERGRGPRESKLAAFERRTVRLGTQDEEVVEVTDGLKPGDEIVVENAYLIKSEFERSTLEAGESD
jgi:multidrug efflux pump subunit AcrA (membrane-fusion protein)